MHLSVACKEHGGGSDTELWRTSRLSLIDLAGNERVAKSQVISYTRLCANACLHMRVNIGLAGNERVAKSQAIAHASHIRVYVRVHVYICV